MRYATLVMLTTSILSLVIVVFVVTIFPRVINHQGYYLDLETNLGVVCPQRATRYTNDIPYRSNFQSTA